KARAFLLRYLTIPSPRQGASVVPNHVNVACPNCQQTIAIPAGIAPGNRLRCPLCQQPFAVQTEEAATRSLVQAPSVTATLPPAASGAAPTTAGADMDANQATFTLDPQGSAKAESTDAAPALKKIGRFEIRRVLGEGGFGIVYEAYDPQLDRAIALK